MISTPKFRTTGKTIKDAKLFLLCSNCDKDIRQIQKHEEINMTKGYYCKNCDDGVIRLNMPTDRK